QKLLLDEETGLRGFLLSQREDFLEPLHDAENQLGPALASLRALVSDNPEQIARLAELDEHHATWIAAARRNIDGVHAGTIAPMHQPTAIIDDLRVRKQLMDQMRAVVDRGLQQERSLLSERRLRAEQRTRNAIWGGGGVILAMALLIGLFVYRGLKRVQGTYAKALDGEQQARRAADALAAEVIEQSRQVEAKYRETADARQRAERRLAELEGKPPT
ncbi:MAG: CHASE3 domain-containing protein, partial [Polyangia bacterium]